MPDFMKTSYEEFVARDTERFDWFFGPTEKFSFLETYLKGMREGWTPDQWRNAIDLEMAKNAENESQT